MPEPLQETPDIGADAMDATIRDAWRGMQNNGQIGSEETAEVAIGQETETEGETVSPERDPQGRFVAKQKPEEEVAEESVEAEAETEVEAEETTEEDEVYEPYSSAPTTWKKDAAEGWKDLPVHVRQEIHRREQNMLDGIKQYKESADFGNSLWKEFQPYEPLMRALNTNPQEAVKVMLNQEYVLRQGTPEQKGQLIADAIKTYGIDPKLIRLDGGQRSEVPADLQQHLTPLQQEVEALKRQLQQRDEQAQQASDAATRAQRDEVAGEVEKFRTALDDTGKLRNPYFDQVRDDMSALIANGRANGLQDAYDKATWANPEVRAKLIAAQRKAEREAAAKKAADAKKAAAANVETQGTLPGKAPTGTMEDTIRATYRQLNGG